MKEKTMALNWVEEVVSHLYKLRGYVVIENEDFPTPRGVAGRAEADIIAFKEKELLHVECMSYWGSMTKNEEFQRLNNKFERVQDQIFEKYNFLKQYGPIKKVFVVGGRAPKRRRNGPWNRLEEFCRNNDIELIEINTVIEDLIRELRYKYPKRKGIVGKEEGVSRFLLHLIHNNFLKRPPE